MATVARPTKRARRDGEMSESTIDRTVLPIRRPPFARRDEENARGLRARLEPGGAPGSARGRAERPRSSSSTTPASATRAPSAARSIRRTTHAWPRKACATTASTSRPSARRPAPRCSRPQPAPRRLRPRERVLRPVPRLQRDDPARLRDAPADPAGERLHDGRFGKWHLTPDDQQSSAGPFNRWPNGLGFDYFWGFLGGEAGQYDPLIFENQKAIGVPESKDGEAVLLPGRHGGEDDRLAPSDPRAGLDDAVVRVLRDGLQPRAAPRSARVVGQVQGRLRRGLGRHARADVRAPEGAGRGSGGRRADDPSTRRSRPGTRSTRPRKRLYARQMEVYAGYSENCDWNIGRIIDAIEDMGELDNTLVIWIWGDNGASMEGTLTGTFNEMTTLNGIPLTAEQQMGLLFKHGGLEAWGGDALAPHYSSNWALASNTPFQWGKQVASHLGGTRNPLVVRYPSRSRDAGRRPEPVHARDRHRADRPRPGRHPRARRASTASSSSRWTGSRSRARFGDGSAPPNTTRSSTSRRSATGRCTRTAGGSASGSSESPGSSTPRSCAASGPAGIPTPTRSSSTTSPTTSRRRGTSPSSIPEKVEELRKLFWEEAERNNVLPLLGGLSSFYGIVPPLPKETKFTYRGRIENVAAGAIPRIYNHSYTIGADLVDPRGRRRGRDRGGVRPPRRIRALHPGREAQAPLLDARRARVHAGVGGRVPERVT